MARKHAHRGRRRTSGGGPRRRAELLEGTIRVARPGVATVETSEGRFAVAKGGIRQAMDGDVVRVAVVLRGGHEPMVVVRDVVSRAITSFVGSFSWADPLGVVSPLDARLRRDFFVLPQDTSVSRLGVGEGDVVRARILEYPARGNAGVVTLDERLGAVGELDLLVEQVVASFGLPGQFPEAVLAEAEGLACNVERTLAAEPLRQDLRELLCVTIDPTDARDFDDAVGARRLPVGAELPGGGVLAQGGFELDVHIADVSHFVCWDSSIDNEARQRTCSVYLVDRVIPMLPERLCNDLCSLRPHEDRLAMSVHMVLDTHGELRWSEACSSVIRSAARLDYDTVDAVLKGQLLDSDLSEATAQPNEVAEMLGVLDEVARLRRELRYRRGAVDFETREAKVVLDSAGHPVGTSVRTRTAATSLVEEAMLLANETVAGMLAAAEVPAAFRTHEPPAPDDLKAALPVLSAIFSGRHALRSDGTPILNRDALVAGSPQALQAVLDAARGSLAEQLVSSVLLRAQKRAIYQPENLGHYALGASAYCHFTSPIRRYPDLVVHRALKALLEGTRDSRPMQAQARALPQICRDCSERERVADAADRASHKAKMAELFSEYIGREFTGVVMGCERFGLFVTLDESGAEGLLATRELGEEWFAYDEARMCLIGESTGRVWSVGRPVCVRVLRTNPARGQIDFALA